MGDRNQIQYDHNLIVMKQYEYIHNFWQNMDIMLLVQLGHIRTQHSRSKPKQQTRNEIANTITSLQKL